MIKISHLEMFNIESAFRGLRNPMNSWDRSDSKWGGYNNQDFIIGENDLKLAQRMIKAGTDESKFMRQIFVSMDIEAPLYWWKEMDTYKVATVANSCSTMHKITASPITVDCFSFDSKIWELEVRDEYYEDENLIYHYLLESYITNIVEACELLRVKYLETKNKDYWRALIQLLPESFNQKRTWSANYQVLRNIYFARRNHKLSEWHDFCNEIKKLPYSEQLITWEGY